MGDEPTGVGWTAWILQSKSICHYDVRWFADTLNLEEAFVPSLNDAVDQGRRKAINEKIAEKHLPEQAWDYESLRSFLKDNDRKPC